MSTTEHGRTTSMRGAPVWTRILLLLTVALVGAYTVWTFPGVRPAPGFDPRFDGLLQGGAYTCLAVFAVIGTWQRRTASAVSWFIVAFLVLRAVGFGIALTGLGLGHTPSYPSWADAAWLASSLCLFVGLVLRLRILSRRRGMLIILDAVSVSLVALGLVINALDSPLQALAGVGVARPAIVMNIVYPVLDVALLVATAWLLTTARSRITRADLALVAGVVTLAVVDVAYFVLLAEGLWRPGTWVSSLSTIATLVVATSVALPRLAWRARRTPLRRTGELPAADLASGINVPAALVGILIVVCALSGYIIPAVAPALLCYGVGGAIAITRGVLTVRSVQLEAQRVLGVASVDVQLFKSLVDASGELIGIAGADGRLLYLNPAGRELLHVRDPAQVPDLHVSELVPGVGPTTFDRRWPELLRRGRFVGEAEAIPVDASPPVPVEVSTFVVEDPAQEGGVVVATIQRDISERRRNERAMHDLAEQRARLLQRLVKAQEDERARIAGDVHDDSVQVLAAVSLRLGMLRRHIAKQAPSLADDVETLQEIVSIATERLRHLLFDLESLPEGMSLSTAVEEAANFIFAGTDVEVRVVGENDLPIPAAERVTIHRVVKEALVNARKHAGATTVVIELAVSDDHAVATVVDDGRGIADGEDRDRPGHLGLSGMRDRAQVAGASVEVVRRAEGGTRVCLRLPLPRVGAACD